MEARGNFIERFVPGNAGEAAFSFRADAAERVELGEKARVLGNVRYSVIETAVGAQINGKLIHRTNPTAGEGDAGPTGSPPL